MGGGAAQRIEPPHRPERPSPKPLAQGQTTYNAATLDPRNDNDTQYAAFYYPWIVTTDPLTGQRVNIPPGGPACGIYARSANERGVWKAPANETVAGALDLEYDIDHGTQELLNLRGVNVIRRFPGRGIRVCGARTLSSDPLWKYVSVRRLFSFIEASICKSPQRVVFEPNDPNLWARVKQTVTLFLCTQWRKRALFGKSEERPFLVNVGRETMTEDDILNGRLILEVGIAPVRPAEFVIFRVLPEDGGSGRREPGGLGRLLHHVRGAALRGEVVEREGGDRMRRETPGTPRIPGVYLVAGPALVNAPTGSPSLLPWRRDGPPGSR